MVDTATPSAITGHDVVRRIRDHKAEFQDRAETAERNRRLPEKSVTTLVDAGVARMLVPRRFGGAELDMNAWFDVVSEIGEVDASHAWCAGLLISWPHMVAYFPDQAQREVWADGPDVLIAGGVPPVCTVEQTSGGYRLSGRSPFISGVTHSSWVVVAGMVTGDSAPQWCYFLVPQGDYTVEDTWFTVGMRATGSNTVVVDDVFVPEHRVLRLADFREGHGPGSSTNPAPLYQLPWLSFAPLTFVGSMLGAARGGYEQFREWARTRAEFASVHLRMATVGTDLDMAELLVRRAIAETTKPAAPSLEIRTRSMRDFCRTAQLAVSSIDTVLAMSGTAGFAESNAVQRAWRDIHFAATHVSLNPEVNAVPWARMELGLARSATTQLY
ncbi:acyl-CoA dehydrogenase family protein [Kibdelosporangium phytohabitans]|uniref:Acyl-CoA dehydrogenase n=1 Tax=Kibdelosporangium phytohabitans TaxID=860235 RepID=A0A0N9I2X9_9PSEU|nr:acyl-CoA dehydrogenase family protein [Kibdelosporangium phytohabitans]ALG10395.1 hypothetical protein AOZ06_29015 [Kibdelosporangium phytohabitans]MBE1461455.1 3-hydroxy-9,10-secoandrosta-1,3,5(10)-triene-9,17-dione monooxygenase [Kibdelosporangium phytohabitans]